MAKINSTSTMNILGQLQGNDKEMGRNLLKLATGQKLNSSGDDTSGFTISERMRVRLRALERAGENTQTGYNMIDTASRAVQEQLNLMRTIKEKVIDAHNDSNTDADRLIIQKEITHAFQEIQDIAYETTYNGKRLLSGGDYVKESVFAWEKLDYAVKVEGSDKLNIIPDKFDVLDDQEGAFDVFSLWETKTSNDGGKTGLVTVAPWEVDSTDLVNSEHAVLEATFQYNSVSEMDAKGVYIDLYNDEGTNPSKRYVFASTTGRSYMYSAREVSLSGVTSVEGAVAKLAEAINSDYSSYVTASASGKKLTLTSKADTAWGDLNQISGTSMSGSSSGGTSRASASNTGASFGSFSGGTDVHGEPSDPDSNYRPATPATATVTGLSSADTGSGFTMSIYGTYGLSTRYVRIVDGNDQFTSNSDGTYNLGKNASFSNVHFGGAIITMSGGTMTLVTEKNSSSANYSRFTDGIPSHTATPSTYQAVTAADITKSGHGGTYTTSQYTLDVSSYIGETSSEKLEEFIQSLAGITNNYFTLKSTKANTSYGPYEFIDTGGKSALAAITKVERGTNSTKIDLNNMRAAVDSGKDIAEAFAATVKAVANTNGNAKIYTEIYEKDGNVAGVTFHNAYRKNASTLFTDSDATLGHYVVDFSSVNASNISNLDDTGFRFYCATDDLQWYNFLFDDGKEDLPDRPASGTATLDIHTATVDISKVTDTASLVEAIYRDGDVMMEEQNHYYRLSLDAGDSSKLIIYDPRRFNISTYDAYRGRYNQRGAKIADGVMDNVIKSRRDIMQKKIVIQDTDKADFHTRLYIDQTTLDHLFEYRVGNDDIFNYRISDAKTREKLLGNDETGEKGMLDTAINHLLEAQTLLGAQAMRLEATSTNLTVSAENEQASESVIRDADMAKVTVEFAKANILTQSSQAMLAQANNDTGSVLSLLQ